MSIESEQALLRFDASAPLACDRCGNVQHSHSGPFKEAGDETLCPSCHYSAGRRTLADLMADTRAATDRGKVSAIIRPAEADLATIERSKLTPQLRYAILHRDRFRCKACGATPESGALLHIDHIKPIARGGLTEWDNLQALCATCNIGKGATWTDPEAASTS